MRPLLWLSASLLLVSLPPREVCAQQKQGAPQEQEAQEGDFLEEDLDADLDEPSAPGAGQQLEAEEDIDLEGGAAEDQAAGEDLEYIDDLLEGDEDVLDSSGFTYDDGGRRDPFMSLLEVAERRARPTGPRPEGIAGLMIDELTLTGVWVTGNGPVAQVQAADRAKSFLLRPGDQLFDGDVVRITYERYAGAEVVFKQILDDPTARKPFREIVRRLEP